MIVAEEIVERVLRLPEPLQPEVPDFVEFLLAKTSGETGKEENRRWIRFSLQPASKMSRNFERFTRGTRSHIPWNVKLWESPAKPGVHP